MMWAVATLRRISCELVCYQDGRHISPEVLDSYFTALERAYRDILMQETLDGPNNGSEQACFCLKQALEILQEIEQLQSVDSIQSTPQLLYTSLAGRPSFEIPREQITVLIESQFTVPQIADLIGVSVRTVYRRMSRYGLSVSSTYSELTDEELDAITSDIHKEFPTCGSKQMSGHLLSRGIRVQQNRIRESIHRIDPEGSVARRLQTISRRTYRVPAPRSLFHIDGNHKLIRYKSAFSSSC